MPVVIGNFEVMPVAAPAPTPPTAASGEDTAQQKEPPTPCAVAAAMRCLEAQMLRTWAH